MKKREPKQEEPTQDEPIECTYAGRTITQGWAPNGWPILHYFEGEQEYGLMYRLGDIEDKAIALKSLQYDIDVRDRKAILPSSTRYTATEKGFIDSFNHIAGEVAKTSEEKGWRAKPRSDGEQIALIHSELSEALEALRHDNPPDDKIPEFTGAEAELADAIIRIMDIATSRPMPNPTGGSAKASYNWRIAEALIAKLAYNKTRPYRHGGKLF